MKNLEAGESLVVDEDGLIAYQTTCSVSATPAGSVAFCCQGGEGCCDGKILGPGKVYVTSMGFEKWRRLTSPGYAMALKPGERAPAVGTT